MASPPKVGSTSVVLAGDYDKQPAVAVDSKDFAAIDETSTSEDAASEQEFDALKKNPFLDPDVAEHWRQVYEDAEYECRHVFDPHLTWTEEEEKVVIRKLDWRACAWAVSPPRLPLASEHWAWRNVSL